MNIVVGNQEYEIEMEVDNSVAGADIINQGLEYARKILMSSPICQQLEQLPFDGIFAYEDKAINAFSIRTGGVYLIGFSYGFFVKTYKWLMLWKKSPQISEILDIDVEKIKDMFFEDMYIFMVMFVATHEAYHILNGHCDLPENENRFMSEISDMKRGWNLESQILEYDADFCASQFCTRVILSCDASPLIKVQTVRALWLGLYNIFLLFNDTAEGEHFKFVINADFSLDTHPHAGIRSVYCHVAILDILLGYFDLEYVKHIANHMVKDCVLFDRTLMRHNNFKECLFAPAYTYKGVQHIMFLVNEWKLERDRLMPYAHINLREYEPIDKMFFWVDEEGDFIKKK